MLPGRNTSFRHAALPWAPKRWRWAAAGLSSREGRSLPSRSFGICSRQFKHLRRHLHMHGATPPQCNNVSIAINRLSRATLPEPITGINIPTLAALYGHSSSVPSTSCPLHKCRTKVCGSCPAHRECIVGWKLMGPFGAENSTSQDAYRSNSHV